MKSMKDLSVIEKELCAGDGKVPGKVFLFRRVLIKSFSSHHRRQSAEGILMAVVAAAAASHGVVSSAH